MKARWDTTVVITNRTAMTTADGAPATAWVPGDVAIIATITTIIP